MDLVTIKDKLLETGEFEDNSYLNDYCELIEKCRQIEYIPSKMNRHHIIPRSYYKYNNMVVDNSDSNIAVLLFKDHILAHYLLYMSSNSLQRYCNAHAVIHLVRQCHLTVENLSEMFSTINLNDCQELYENFKSGLHEVLSNKCSGESNGNCKLKDKNVLEEIKYLLNNSDLTYGEISLVTEAPKRIISMVSNGTHWSCKEDGFISKRVLKYREKHSKYCMECKKEKEQNKIQSQNERLQKKLEKEKKDNDAYLEWLSEPRFCKACGKPMSEYYISKKYGKGIFCSGHCVRSYVASLRDKDFYKNAVKNRRSFAGEGNPNFGKKASEELRKKFSDIYKNNYGVKNSPRFKGMKHTDESKKKTSESMRKYYEKKQKCK